LIYSFFFGEEMLDCFKDKSVKVLEEYREDENTCRKKTGGPGWWSHLFIFDYVAIFILRLISGIVGTYTDPYVMYVPTTNITTAVVDSSGVPHNVVQNINIAGDVQYPEAGESLSNFLIALILSLCSLFCWLFSQLVFLRLATRKWHIAHDVHNFLVGIYESRALQYFYVCVLQPFAGRNRPNYAETVAQASSDPDTIAYARMSYPSSYAAASFATLVFCALYILGKSRVYSRNSRFGGGAAGRFVVLIFVSFLVLCAFLISVSRTRDYVNNFSDINAGAIMGIISAVLAYFHMYPPLSDPLCHLPRIRLAENSPIQSRNKEEDDGTSLTEVLVNKDYSEPELPEAEEKEKVAEVTDEAKSA